MRGIVAFLAFACAHSIESPNHAFKEQLEPLEDIQEIRIDRDLASLECAYGAGPDNHFVVQVDITSRSGSTFEACSPELQKSIGALLNVVLDDFGFGKSGKGDRAVFAAEVCEVPSSKRRRLAQSFSWAGSGLCKSCGADNRDGRMLETSEDKTWFPKTYAPELKKKLEMGIAKSLPTNNTKECLGASPSVTVNIQLVTSQPQINCGS
jgi:hypothetical protein